MIGSNGSAHEHVYPNVVEGVIEAKNPKGIRIDGDWFNVSNFKPVELPDVGAVVRLKVQPKGFIQSLEVLKALPDSGTPAVSSGRDATIARLAVLKAAAGFAAGRQDIKSADVLRIADGWLAWVNQ